MQMNLPMGLNADKITAAVAELRKSVKKVAPVTCRPTVPRLSDLENLRRDLVTLLERLRDRELNVQALTPHVRGLAGELKKHRAALEAVEASNLRETGDTVYTLRRKIEHLEGLYAADKTRLDHNTAMVAVHTEQIREWVACHGEYYEELLALDKALDRANNRFAASNL